MVHLAEAGGSTPESASITGHAIEETQRILDTYWVATRRQAKAAITKLERAVKKASEQLAAAAGFLAGKHASIGRLGRAHRHLENQLTDLHPLVEDDLVLGEVGHLELDLAAKPGGIVGAVIWIPTPRRAIELFPSTRAAILERIGSSTVSRVQARRNDFGFRWYCRIVTFSCRWLIDVYLKPGAPGWMGMPGVFFQRSPSAAKVRSTLVEL
ncbi:hypothetical protein U1T56_16300 [Geminicoccaceae bacterium SYSU G07066]|uniref:Transposase n=1 Tax=Benzoatithermus flavus TaxID=3108223 RepID=A0ABU8XUK4_9PROT